MSVNDSYLSGGSLSGRSFRAGQSTSVYDARVDVSTRQEPQDISTLLEMDKKDRQIRDLYAQVKELHYFKEQALNLRQQLSLIDERNKLRTTESRSQSSEFVTQLRQHEETEADLRQQIVFLEQSRLKEARHHGDQLADLQAQNAAMRADFDRREATRVRLEEELTKQAAQLRTERHTAAEREATHISLNRKQQEEIAQQARIRRELEQQLVEYQRIFAQHELQLGQSEGDVTRLHDEVVSLDRARVDSERVVTAQRDQIAVLDEKYAVLVAENTNLRTELAVVPALRLEVSNLQAALDDADAQLTAATRLVRELESRARQSEGERAEFKRQRDELHERYVVPVSPGSELVEKRHQVATMRGENEALRIAMGQLQRDLTEAIQGQQRLQDKYEHAVRSHAASMESLTEELCVAIGSRSLDISALRDMSFAIEGSSADERSHRALSDLRGKVTAVIATLTAVRATATQLSSETQLQQSILMSTETERNEAQRLLSHSRRNLEGLEGSIRETDRERTRLAERAGGLAATLSEREADLAAINSFLASISADLAQLVGVRPRDALNTSASSSWPAVRAPITEYITQALTQHRADVRTAAASQEEAAQAKNRLDRVTNEAAQERIRLETTFATSQVEQEGSLRGHFNAQLDAQRAMTEKVQMECVSLRSLHDAADRARHDAVVENTRLTNEVADVKAQSHALFVHVSLLARGLKVYRLRNRELVAQKRFLGDQYATSLRLQQDITELQAALSGTLNPNDLMPGPLRPRTTFRAAVIAVIAARRLVRLTANSIFGTVQRLGGVRVALAPADIVPVTAEVSIRAPLSADGRGDAELFARLLAQIDGTLPSEESYLGSVLPSTLGAGLVAFRWWQNRVAQAPRASSPPAKHSSPERAAIGVHAHAYVTAERRLALVRRMAIDLGKRANGAEDTANALRNELTDTNAEVIRLTELARSAETTRRAHSQMTDDLSRRVNALQESQDRMVPSEALTLVQRELESTRAKLNEAERLRTDNGQRATDLAGQLATARNEIQSMETEISSLRHTISASHRDAKERTAELGGLRKSLHETQAQLSREREGMAAMQARTDELLRHEHEVATTTTQMRVAMKGLETELDSKRELVGVLRAQITDLNSQVQVHEARLLRSTSSLESHTIALQSAQESVASLNEAHRKAMERIAILEEEVASYRAHVDAMKLEIRQTTERGVHEREDRAEWEKQRLEIFNSRLAVREEASASASTPSRVRHSPPRGVSSAMAGRPPFRPPGISSLHPSPPKSGFGKSMAQSFDDGP